MIKYALRCSNGHRFDAWFDSSDGCDAQLASGFVACVECGDDAVTKAPMAPRIGRGRRETAGSETVDREPAENAVTAHASSAGADGVGAQSVSGLPPKQMALAGQVREAVETLRRFVEKNADYVGDRFADEARKIHKGEAEERSIYGETTPDEAEALEEEGIPFGKIPWPKHDS